MNGMMDEVRKWQLWFPFLMLVIAAVSLYDTYLIIRFRELIIVLEENPVGSWLLQLGDGGIEIFVRLKLAGTLVVLSALMGMWFYRSRFVFPVTTSVATCQVSLLVYLTAI